MPTKSSNRRATFCVACVAATLVLGGCSSEGGNEWGALYQMTLRSFDRNSSVSLQQASEIPFSTIGVSIGGDNQFLLVLATDDASGQLWTSISKIAIVTKGGRIVRAVNLAENVVIVPEDSRVSSILTPTKTVLTADYPDRNMFSVLIKCESAPDGREKVSILGKDIQTIRVDERCRADQLGWSFTNIYWIDPDGSLVWRTVQNISPRMPPITIEVLRPPR